MSPQKWGTNGPSQGMQGPGCLSARKLVATCSCQRGLAGTLLSAMLLSPQTPPRSSRMSWRSSMGMVSSRGTTLNRYSPFPSSLPHCLLSYTSTVDAAGRPMESPPPSHPIPSPPIPSPPIPSHPIPSHLSCHPIPFHPILSHLIPSLTESILGHFLDRQNQGSDLLSLTPCTSPKAISFAVANLGTWAGPIPCHIQLGKAGVVCSKWCF